MNSTLPAPLKAAMDALLEGVSRRDLAARSAAITDFYRGGQGSAVAIAGESDALAYLVARLPATYAVAAAVLAEVHRAVPGFTPASLLDAGAGPGTATWAARATWPALSRATLADSNPRFLDLARKLVPDADILARNLTRDALPAADLVIANFVIAEFADPQAIVARLYGATNDVLVLIEPGTPQGFARIRAARAQLIGKGAHVLAPCTHANDCPMISADWCHFSQRLPRSRDHLQTKSASVPYEDERYCWLAVSRTLRSSHEGKARILAPPRDSKPGIELKLCTPDGVEPRFIARRDKEAYALVRRAKWGDLV
ncbi:MAG TPA: small ribosomal subunit Rsm22 family protein [Rhizomicrobium sp.]|nr:small ribosomal subunit Rsm22 family protein [Rhizomicrobium sp.]